jgi:S-DNA-T family DNA segregation ATPase FtsK/SpoIIIE
VLPRRARGVAAVSGVDRRPSGDLIGGAFVAADAVRRLRTEILGLLLWASAVFLVMSLLSYSSVDPSLNNTGTPGQPIRNWGGVVGAYLSDLLLQSVGLVSFVFPLLLVVVGWGLLRGSGLGWRSWQWVGLAMTALALTTILHLLLGRGASSAPARLAGGLVGYLTSSALARYTNVGGTWVAAMLVLCVGALMITRTTLAEALAGAPRLASWALGVLRGALGGVARGRADEVKPYAKPVKRPSLPQPTIVEPPHRKTVRQPPRQEAFPFVDGSSGYRPPPISLLDLPPPSGSALDKEALKVNARLLEKKLEDFGVAGKVTEIHPGPIVTLYEFEPAPGIKISRIVSLHDDLAMALRALSVRIIAPIPGKAVVGIEIPNSQREMVCLREILASETFQKAAHRLTVALGKDTVGRPVVANLASMPHLLIAGATGSGKSVCLNAIITSILFKASPQEVKFLMVDPKRLELSVYRDIPHLLHPVVVEPKKAAVALGWAVKEMERRYRWMERAGVRNIDRYNAKMAKGGMAAASSAGGPDEAEELPARLPYIVIVIDELSDLMMVVSREVEDVVLRLAQMARAAGIHLVVATQRPSVDVLTGTIKINLPVRIAFQVTSKFDSRTILDTQGAENLLGAGDMLFLPPGTAGMQRIHGAYVSEGEIRAVVDYLKQQARPEYDTTVLEGPGPEGEELGNGATDEKYEEAVALVCRLRQASISLIQRHLRVGYNRAARMIERMEAEGIVGPSDGSKPREVLSRPVK